MKNNENGRSMVEMLGVLAIIGVLSASALSGYSKAMHKIRLNNFTVDYAELLHNAMEILPKVDDGTPSSLKAEMLKALNIIPNNMHIAENFFIEDKYGHTFWVFYAGSFYGVGFGFQSNDASKELCRTAVQIAKKHENLTLISVDRYIPETEKYSPRYEKAGNEIGALTIEEIKHMCDCDQDQCRLYVQWK